MKGNSESEIESPAGRHLIKRLCRSDGERAVDHSGRRVGGWVVYGWLSKGDSELRELEHWTLERPKDVCFAWGWEAKKLASLMPLDVEGLFAIFPSKNRVATATLVLQKGSGYIGNVAHIPDRKPKGARSQREL